MPGQAISREERAARDALAEVLERRGADIEQRWLRALQRDLEVHHVAASDLRDGIGAYLGQLAKALRSNAAIVPGGVDAWKDVAREHALTRVRQGFDVGQLVHEFILLRREIFAMVGEERITSMAAQAAIVADLLEAAIADAVGSYGEARDFAARKAEAEHVGFVTHELRNPLTAAIQAAARLEQQPVVQQSAGAVLAVLGRSLERLRRLIDRVLENERISSGELVAKPVDMPLGPLMTEALRVARERAEEKGLQFCADYDADTCVSVDAQLSTSALQNVVDNAVKFTDEGRVTVTCEDRGDQLVVHVRDNCGGLSEAELRTIFEPFERGHTRERGSGLGLAIARRSIEAQGGTIGAESPGERGCHFWLTLPKARACS